MTAILSDYEYREFEAWVKVEYPDMNVEFNELPKTLMDYIEARYPYLVKEYVEDTGQGVVVHCI